MGENAGRASQPEEVDHNRRALDCHGGLYL